ncbi:hypothetical protein F4818DRAFT_163254 [Hypoxylon cercidicola]|nr:hypothetical protein F4818DRAFT_163254 [Hypoxylon cercidicola]
MAVMVLSCLVALTSEYHRWVSLFSTWPQKRSYRINTLLLRESRCLILGSLRFTDRRSLQSETNTRRASSTSTERTWYKLTLYCYIEMNIKVLVALWHKSNRLQFPSAAMLPA